MTADRSTLRRLRTGDKNALRDIIDRHHRPLHAFLYRFTGDTTLADDLTQQTFIKLLVYEGDVPDELRGWLLTVGRNLAYDYFRSAAYRREQMTDFTEANEHIEPEAEPTPEQLAIHADQRQEIAGLLGRLPAAQREVVVLRYYHDLSLAEIGEVVSAPVGTVKSRLFHALKKLKVYAMEIGQSDEVNAYDG